jgi:hypothetical protein
MKRRPWIFLPPEAIEKMLTALGLSQPSIKVIVLQSLLFLYPPATPDILNLPKAREVKSLVVKIVGHYNLSKRKVGN